MVKSIYWIHLEAARRGRAETGIPRIQSGLRDRVSAMVDGQGNGPGEFRDRSTWRKPRPDRQDRKQFSADGESMAQPKWNQAESLILLDALLRVRDGRLTRPQAVQEVSGLLRQMAVNQGQEIDETFRNTNGISWQISIMEGALTGAGKTAAKAPRVFRDAVALYRENPEDYARRLQEAKEMAKLVPFEFDEAVLLLDALLRVRSGEIRRSAALQDLSAALRERAVRLGREVDESFRPGDGLAKRMISMEQLLDDSIYYSNNRPTELFRQVYALYLEHPAEYEAALQRAKASAGLASEEEEPTPDPAAVAEAVSAPVAKGEPVSMAEIVSMPAAETAPSPAAEPETTALPEPETAAETATAAAGPARGSGSTGSSGTRYVFPSDRTGRKVSQPQRSAYHSDRATTDTVSSPERQVSPTTVSAPGPTGAQTAQEPLRNSGYTAAAAGDRSTQSEPEPGTQIVQGSDIRVVDFKQIDDIGGGSKPVALTCFQHQRTGFASWRELYASVLQILMEDHEEVLRRGIRADRNGAGRLFVNEERSRSMRHPRRISEDLYVETHYSAATLLKNLRRILNACSIGYKNIRIQYRVGDPAEAEEQPAGSSGVRQPDRTGTKVSQPQLSFYRTSQSSTTVSQIAGILEKTFPYGFKIGNLIDDIKFRNAAEVEGIALPADNGELEALISRAGMQIEGKVFYFGKTVFDELTDLLRAAFDTGAEAVFLKPFMQKHEEWMQEHHIPSDDLLRTLLRSSSAGYYVGWNLITPGREKTELEAVASEIHRVSGDTSLIRISELQEKLEYIPADKIPWTLSASPDFIFVRDGIYFDMAFFQISEEEKEQIRQTASSECLKNGYASMADLPLELLAEQNCELPQTALYDAVYLAALKPDFFRNGKILAREENGPDIQTLLKAYCTGRQSCSFSEVQEKCRELTGGADRQNVFGVLYGTMVRINKTQFVSDDQVHFDVEKIDDLLQEIIGSSFAPLQCFGTFALFPSCGFTWNYYLLESFCCRFSRRYKLCVMNYNNRNAGIIAAKTLSMSYTDMLVEAAARANVELSEEAVGRYFQQTGLTAKSSYASLPEIVERAKARREEL